MRVVENLPREFERFRQIGGALHFAVYEDAAEDETEALVAIGSTIPDLDTDTLKSLGCKRIDKRSFFGDWYDAGTDSVLRIGEFTLSDGTKLINPRLKDLEGMDIRSGGSPLPEAGAGGQFAYAFSWTPYGLRAGPVEVQELFTAVRKFVFPQISSTTSWIGPAHVCPRFQNSSPPAWSGGECSYLQSMYLRSGGSR
jgi:hypothetical protein